MPNISQEPGQCNLNPGLQIACTQYLVSQVDTPGPVVLKK